MRNKENMEKFYDESLQKILSFKADDMKVQEFTRVKKYSNKYPVYIFKKNRDVSLEDLWAKGRTGESGNE